MASGPQPVPDQAVIELVLSGLAKGSEVGELAAELAPMTSKRDLFPSEILLSLAADVLELSGATRDKPLESERIRGRYLPEGHASTRAQHYKADFAIAAAAMIRAGVDPALLDNAAGWAVNDLWLWSLDALVVYVRATADYAGQSVAEVCRRVAERHGITL